MAKVGLKEEIEEVRTQLNFLVVSKCGSCCNHEILLDLSRKLDSLIVEYINGEQGVQHSGI